MFRIILHSFKKTVQKFQHFCHWFYKLSTHFLLPLQNTIWRYNKHNFLVDSVFGMYLCGWRRSEQHSKAYAWDKFKHFKMSWSPSQRHLVYRDRPKCIRILTSFSIRFISIQVIRMVCSRFFEMVLRVENRFACRKIDYCVHRHRAYRIPIAYHNTFEWWKSTKCELIKCFALYLLYAVGLFALYCLCVLHRLFSVY